MWAHFCSPQEKLTDLEDRSLRNNIRVYGISKSKNKSWEVCEEDVEKVLRIKLSYKI